MALDILNLSVPVPCIQGSFGKKLLTYQTNVPPASIPQLLGHDPRSNNWNRLPEELGTIYRHIQRKTDKGRRTAAYRYIEKRMHDKSQTIGGFPAVSIGCTKPLEFVSYADSHNVPTIRKAVGELQFNLSAENRRILLDGLARLTGALDLMNDGGPEGRALVERITFPVTIYAPSKDTGELTLAELGQLFHDFNFLAEPVKKAQAIDLDQSDIYIALTNQLARQPVIRDNGGVEHRAASLGKKSTALVVKPVLLRFVRLACEGGDDRRSLRAAPAEQNLTDPTFETLLLKLSTFLEHLAAGMGSRFKDRTSIHLLTPAWYALGILFHDLEFRLSELSTEDKDRMIQSIGALDWSRSNPVWDPVLNARGGVQGTLTTVDIIRNACGIPEPQKTEEDAQETTPAAPSEVDTATAAG